MSFAQRLHVYKEDEPQSAAMNMAIDEAILESADMPVIRFYGWKRPSLSFGYFGAFDEVAGEMNERDVVRRWTGGGIVMHGGDSTYSVILPRMNGTPPSRSPIVYAAIHEAMQRAFAPHMTVELARNNSAKISAACFANPVTADVLVQGRKIAGAAQRRTRAGLLHQGSIQCETLPENFNDAFAAALCPKFERRDLPTPVVVRARELAQQKYGTADWLRQR